SNAISTPSLHDALPILKKLEAPHQTSRALVGQAPYIANAVLDYTHPRWGSYRLLYNTAGPTIVYAGTIGLPDVEEQQRNQLDFRSEEHTSELQSRFDLV